MGNFSLISNWSITGEIGGEELNRKERVYLAKKNRSSTPSDHLKVPFSRSRKNFIIESTI